MMKRMFGRRDCAARATLGARAIAIEPITASRLLMLI
jgi:hypothetical protein